MKKKFKKLTLLMAVVAMAMVCFVFSASALAKTGKCGDNVKWKFDSSIGKLTISGTGNMYSYWGDSPFEGESGIKTVIIKSGVTGLGGEAFRDCKNLSSVTVANTVTDMGYDTFSGCSKLKSVNIPSGVTELDGNLFYGCSRLASITIPENVVSIGYMAFSGCESLKSITFPEKLKYIESNAFEYCSSLKSVTIPESVTSIGYSAFYDCSNLKKLVVKNPFCSMEGYLHDNTTVYSCNGSLAKEFANENGFKFVASFENPVKSVKFTPAKTVFYKDLSLKNDVFYDSKSYPVFDNVGDKLTITYKDSTKKVYVNSVKGRFVSSDGEEFSCIELTTDQGEYPLKLGKNTIKGKCGAMSFKYTVTLKKCPIKSITASYKYSLYKDYDCTLYRSCSSNNSYGDVSYSGFLNTEDIICKVVLSDGSKITSTPKKLSAKYDVPFSYSVDIEKVGSNKGTFSLGSFSTDLVINVIEKFTEKNTPDSIVIASGVALERNKEIDIQLVKFADKGHSHTVTAIDVPDGIKIDKNGRMTGKLPSDFSIGGKGGGGRITFEIRWKDSNAHKFYTIPIHVAGKEDKVAIPSKAEKISFNKRISVKCSDGNVKWYKFTALSGSVGMYWSDFSGGKELDIYSDDGYPLTPNGYGYGASYNVQYGKTYYIRVARSLKLEVYASLWKPERNGEEEKATNSSTELTSTNIKKTFKSDSNTKWNVYTLKANYKIDFNGGFTYESFGTMKYFASPVKIHMVRDKVKSNVDVIGISTYSFDPNNVKECEELGISTTQKTMKDELKEGEKEYRYDVVYHMIPEVGKLNLTETIKLYVPVGYYLDDDTNHIKKCTKHTYKTVATTKATLSKNGKSVKQCTRCCKNLADSTGTIYSVKSVKLAKSTYTYDGKTKSPSVVVKDSKGNTLKKGTDYTVKYASGRKNPGKYTVTVTFKGKYTGTKKLTLTIKPKAPAISSVTSSGKGKATVKWNNVAGESGYQVYYSTSKNGTYKSAASASANKTSASKSKLTSKKTYYFKVRAYKKTSSGTVFSSWSSVKSVKVK